MSFSLQWRDVLKNHPELMLINLQDLSALKQVNDDDDVSPLMELFTTLNTSFFTSLPEINKEENPMFNARRIVQLHIKLSYLTLLSSKDILVYAHSHPHHAVEVETMRDVFEMKSVVEKVKCMAHLLDISSSNDTWMHTLRYVEQALTLAEPTELLLTRGCDDRTMLKKGTKMNKYYTSTVPYSNVIGRSSCTCSFTIADTFSHIDRLRRELLSKALSGHLSKDPLDKEFTRKMEK